MSIKLPIGIQDFAELRTGNFVYIDKTELLHSIVTASKTYFLSRPRRFGKSLLLSTLRYLFEGRKDLFKDLWIESHWNWSEKAPVIRLSLDAIGHKEKGLKPALLGALALIATEFNIVLKASEPSLAFQELIRTLAAKQGKVIILIDEYDRPIIDYLGLKTVHRAETNRDILKSFFSILKSEDANIRFLFLTGISKFSRVSIFSDLNHLQDLSPLSRFNNICGYTQIELEHYFAPLLSELPTDTLPKLQEWYNGYSWDGRNFVYNPFSILNFFSAKEYLNFWFVTGTPTFLVKQLNRNFEYHFNKIEVDALQIESFELDNLDPFALLFQTGYLTIKEKTEFGTVILDFPNREVKEALLRALVADYTHISSVIPRIVQINQSLKQNNLNKTIELLNGLFKSIPNQLFIANREAYYHSIIYLAFLLIGIHVQAEVNSSDGRLDAIVQTPERIYIFEFKLFETAIDALNQIRVKDYAAPYRSLNKPIIGVGVQFSTEIKGIADWKSELL